MNDTYSEFDEIIEESDELMVDDLYVIVIVADNKYAIPVKYVNEIIILPKITPMPESPEHIRGVIKLRESIIPLVDTRMRFKIPTFEDIENSLISELMLRKQDHINWLNELKVCIDEDREFKLTTDPHACAFGKWYDSFKSDSNFLASYLAKFDWPHKQVHAIAEKAIKLRKEKGVDAAQELLCQVQNNELARIIELIDNMKSALVESRREVAIIVNIDEALYALTADSSDSVITIESEKIKITNEVKSAYTNGIYTDDNNIILMMDLPKFILLQ